MHTIRTDWLIRLTLASLAIVAALFVAHLGSHDHADECPACEIAAHALADAPPETEFALQSTLSSAVVAQAPPAIFGQRTTPASPRGPPHS